MTETIVPVATLSFTPESLTLNGRELASDIPRPLTPASVYRALAGDYPKFFKMDEMSRLAFICAEFILADLSPEEKEHAGIIMFNRDGSLVTDRRHQSTIGHTSQECLASPAIFVYTLPNIAAGEVAIRHKIMGPTSFFVLDNLDGRAAEIILESYYDDRVETPNYAVYPIVSDFPALPIFTLSMKFYSIDPDNFRVNCYLYKC